MNFRQFLAIVELPTKIVSVSTYLLASLYVVLRTGRLDWGKALLMFAATLFVDMGTTAFNSFFDYWRGVDNPLFNREESKVILHEKVPGAYALIIGGALYLAALPLGIVLASLSGWVLLAAGALCLAVGFLYTGGPYPLSRTPLGEIFAGGFLGSVLFLLIFYIHEGPPDGEVFLVSLPSTVMIAAILSVNNTCDIHGDTQTGRRTLSILLGRKGGEQLILGEIITAWLLLAGLGLGGILSRWTGLIILPFAVLSLLVFRRMHRQGYSHETKGVSMKGISQIFILFTLAFAFVFLGEMLYRTL